MSCATPTRRAILAAFGVLLLTCPAPAEVKLPAVFSSHMVLQMSAPIPVWGTAKSGEKVAVTIAGRSASTAADTQGRWKVLLQPIDTPGGPHQMTVAGSNTILFEDVLIGEVWVCSGQSNMQWTVASSRDSEKEIAGANHPNIRLITVPRKSTPEPQDDFTGQWEVCSSKSIPQFSAVGYFFGRELNKTLNIPIGLINTSYGGTPAEAWTTAAGMSDPAYKPLMDGWAQRVQSYDPAKDKARYDKDLAKWKDSAAAARKAGKPAPRQPQPPQNPAVSQHRPSGLYNAMIHPLIPFAIRGAIWYQGESNAGRAEQYRKLFPAMIDSWRTSWKQGDFPFYFVQLANFKDPKPEPGDSDWAELREAQTMTLKKLSNTGMAVIIDIGQAKDIHPKNKQDVGKRLALIALANDYSKRVEYSGPMFNSWSAAGSKARIVFDHAAGLKTPDNAPLTGFALAGPDRLWHWAQAKIVAGRVEVWSDKVTQPVAVRYGWADNPSCNLYNSDGLPASPFRTDNWPMITAGKNN